MLSNAVKLSPKYENYGDRLESLKIFKDTKYAAINRQKIGGESLLSGKD
jgi:hypothetical protein